MSAQQELETIEEEIARLQARRRELTAVPVRQQLKIYIDKEMGETFVYRNNNTGGDGRWDSFKKLIGSGFSKYNVWLVFEECSVDDSGRATLGTHPQVLDRGPIDAFLSDHMWSRCEKSEYEEAKAEVLRQIERPSALISFLEMK